MKKSILYIAALITAAAGFTGCDDDFEQPPYNSSGDSAGEAVAEANTTIEELKALFNQDVNFYNTEIGTKANGEHYIIRGRVTSDTRAGNIFKKVAVEDATGGIFFSVDYSYIYNYTAFGQEVVIDCTGMYYGNYGFGVQVGSQPEPSATSATSAPARMPEDMWKAKATPVGIPEPEKITVHEYTVKELLDLFDDPATRLQCQGYLVKVKDCKFQTPGQQLGTQNVTNNSVYIEDANGGRGSIAINTSGYSRLWSIYAPSGTGDITAVLGRYNQGWQLQLNDAAGIGDTFTPWEAPLYSQPFNKDMGDFTAHNITLPGTSTYVWRVDTSRGYVSASGYVGGTNYACEAWLVSPQFDLNGIEDPAMTFDHAINFFSSADAAKSECTLYISVDGAAWQPLEIANWGTNSDWNFVNAGTFDLAAYKGHKVMFGYRYTGNSTKCGTWEIKNFYFNGKGELNVAPAETIPSFAL